jgi:hypothetical protein
MICSDMLALATCCIHRWKLYIHIMVYVVDQLEDVRTPDFYLTYCVYQQEVADDNVVLNDCT